jgi:hypothetical protein
MIPSPHDGEKVRMRGIKITSTLTSILSLQGEDDRNDTFDTAQSCCAEVHSYQGFDIT